MHINPFRLLWRAFPLWFSELPAMLGLALLCALITGVAGFLTARLAGFEAGSLLWIGTGLLLAHAIFLVLVSRRIARRIDAAAVMPLSLGRVIISSLVLVLLMVLVCAPFTLTYVPVSLAAIMAMVAVFSLTPIVPALALNRPLPPPRAWHRFALAALTAGLPWFAVTEVLGVPAQTCTVECWGFMEGGFIMVPLFGLHTFLATTSAATLSTLAFSAPRLELAASGAIS